MNNSKPQNNDPRDETKESSRSTMLLRFIKTHPVTASLSLVCLGVLCNSYLFSAQGDKNGGFGIDEEQTLRIRSIKGQMQPSAVVNFQELAWQEASKPKPAAQIPVAIPEPLKFPEVDTGPIAPPAVWAPVDLPGLLIPSPGPINSFEGEEDEAQGGGTNGYYTFPPDTTGAVGTDAANKVFVTLNNNYKVQNKTTGAQISLLSMPAFWAQAGASGPFDPRVQYDPYNNRWIVAAVSDRQTPTTAILVGVSATSDPNGVFFTFKVPARVPSDPEDVNYADFPMLGFNRNWVVVTINMFNNSGNFVDGRVLVIDYPTLRTGVLSYSYLVNMYPNFSMHPATTYSATEGTEYLVNHVNSASATYQLSKITGTPNAPVLTIGQLKVRPGGGWADAFGNILPQAAGVPACTGGPSNLESFDHYVRSNVVFRNGTIWYPQIIGLPASGRNRTAVQWTQLDTTGAVIQGGRVDDATATEWYAFPSISVNANNDMLLGFSQFSTGHFANAGYAYRDHTDPLGAQREPFIYKAGQDCYTKDDSTGRNRWGDFSHTVVDPTDDCTFWTIQEYARLRAPPIIGDSDSKWSTWLAKVRPPTCATPTPTATAAATATATATATVTSTPVNDQCSGAIALSNGVTRNDSTVNATSTGDPSVTEDCDDNVPISKGVWYKFTPTTSGTVTVSTCGSSYDTVLEVYTGTCAVRTAIACNDDDGPACPGSAASVNFGGTAGTTYTILAAGYSSSSSGGNLQIVARVSATPTPTATATATATATPTATATATATVTSTPVNDRCSGAIALSNGVTRTDSTLNATSTGDPSPTPCATNYFGKGVWYTFTPASSGTVTVSTCGSDFDTVLQIYTGACAALSPTFCDDDNGPACPGGDASANFNGIAGTTYRILAGGYNSESGNLQIVARVSGTPTPPPPTANPASYIATNSFTANWSSVSGVTGYRLDVSTSSSFNTYVTGYQNLNVGNVTTRSVTGLSANTTYYYRLRAYNNAGTSGNSNVVNVRTLSPTGPPVAVTTAATNVASYSATLNGSVDPHGLSTTVYFQYGTTSSYGRTTANQSKSGNTFQNVAANISGLTANTTYHFRIVATNSGGTRYGVDRTFTTLSATGAPVVTTNPATLIASFSATLNGSVNPHGLSTTAYFQYGTTTSYGRNTANQSKNGNTYQNVAANISGLAASTTYHFRIVATNGGGTRYGVDRTFTTLSATGPPVVTTNPATNVANSSATLNGSVDPHGLTTTVYFQYGTTASYGHNTANQSRSGNTYQNVSANISGLSPSTTYHFRIVANNSAGTRYGSDRTFIPASTCNNSWSLSSSLNWSGVADWDLHLQTPTAHIYHSNLSADSFTLNRDAIPGCNPTPLPPEQITGLGKCGTYRLYSNLSPCGGSPPKTFSATVTAIVPIRINGTLYNPGQTFHPQDGVSFTVALP